MMVCAHGYTFRKHKHTYPIVVTENKRIAMKTNCASESSVETTLRKNLTKILSKR